MDNVEKEDNKETTLHMIDVDNDDQENIFLRLNPNLIVWEFSSRHEDPNGKKIRRFKLLSEIKHAFGESHIYTDNLFRTYQQTSKIMKESDKGAWGAIPDSLYEEIGLDKTRLCIEKLKEPSVQDRYESLAGTAIILLFVCGIGYGGFALFSTAIPFIDEMVDEYGKNAVTEVSVDYEGIQTASAIGHDVEKASGLTTLGNSSDIKKTTNEALEETDLRKNDVRGVDIGMLLGSILGLLIGSYIFYGIHPVLGIVTFFGGLHQILNGYM